MVPWSRPEPRRYSTPTHADSASRRACIPISCEKPSASTFPQLDEREHVRLAGVLRCLGSMQTWLRMREEFGVPGKESGPVVAWAIDTLIREIRAGNGP